jgi:hypothetical protein
MEMFIVPAMMTDYLLIFLPFVPKYFEVHWRMMVVSRTRALCLDGILDETR